MRNSASLYVRVGSISSFRPWSGYFRSSPGNGRPQSRSACRKRADLVAKVENQTILTMSRKSIFGLLCCGDALQRTYDEVLNPMIEVLNETT